MYRKHQYKTDKLPVQMDYLDDIDIPEFKEIPTLQTYVYMYPEE